MNKVIIAGSARNDGDTATLINRLKDQFGWDVIDLNDYNISFYDYDHMNKEDDFLPLIKKLIDQYDTFVLATPVYWYSMSGIMKVFFDRFSDLLTIEKPLGRRLRGKNMAVISSSNGNNLGNSFWLPFEASAKYLGMNYLGNLHTINGHLKDDALEQFRKNTEATNQ